MELISALRFLKINEVSEAWVDEVWELEFTESKPLPGDIEEELTASGEKAFRKLYQCLLPHAVQQDPPADNNDNSQSIWALLGENGVSIKSLVAVLSSFVLAGKAKAAGVPQRVSSLNTASIYLLLLGIPGAIANKVFHEVLMDTCSDMVSHCWPQDSDKKRKKEGMKSSQAEGKRSKPHRKDDQEMEVEEEEEEGEEVHFSGQDLVKLRDSVHLLVQSLLRLLQKFPLKDKPQCATNCTQIFIKLIYFEPVTGELMFGTVQDISKMKSLPDMAFYGLRLLCSPKHGDQKESLRRVFHRLLYVILMMSKRNRTKPALLVPSQAVLKARDHAVHFVCHIVCEMQELALPLLQVLLQHICLQMVEKNEFRTHGAQAVGILTSEMTSIDFACFIKWLLIFSNHSKMACRLFSVDVVMVLLEQPERKLEDCEDPELSHLLSHKFLIQNLLFARRMDESPTVQGHALSCLAQCLELPSLNATRAVHDLFSASGIQTVLEAECTEGHLSAQQTQKTYRTLPFRTVDISSSDDLGSEAKENMALLLRRVSDPKTNVRKSALQALMGLLRHGVIPMSWEYLTVLSERTRDPAVSVKKKALQCLGDLLAAKPMCSVAQKAWLHGVVPAVMDSESSVQEKALEALEQVLLKPVKPFSPGFHVDTEQRLTWDLLAVFCHECQNLSRYFSRAFTIWSKQNKFTAAFISSLITHTEADHSASAWLLLSEVVASSPKLSYTKILDAWDDMISSKDMNVKTCCQILSVMGDIAAHLNNETKERIIVDLMSLLRRFTLSLEEITAAVTTLFQLGRSEDIKQTQAFMNEHCGELLTISESFLSTIILSENGTQNLDEELMVKHLHTLGVVSLHCPTRVSKKTIQVVECVLPSRADKQTDYMENLPASQPLSQFKANSLPPSARAHGVITLGKLCLQHEDLARKYLPVFARELEVGTEVAVRNNMVVVMCDLCVRYTNMVDHYIPNISACLCDNEAVIREQTLIMLTNLLQEEYVKWKGTLFFRFMVALVDPAPAVASLCEYCLVHLLLKKNPEMFSQHFIECIFFFNSYDKHKSYNKFPQTEKEAVGFSLKGARYREKRFRVYRFLLEHFTDAQRFNITNKINQTVLACFADEELPLDGDGADILAETFKVLSLKEMKLQAISSPAGGAAGEEAEDDNVANMAKAVLRVAQKKVVSQVQKKAFIENTVPIVIGLKSLLEQKRSPVLRDLMAYLQVTMQDYRNEVKEFFSGDEQLAAELEFALQTAEKEREMEAQMNICSLGGDAKTPTIPASVKASVQASVQASTGPARILSPFTFASPQLPRPNSLSGGQKQTDRLQERRKSAPLEKTVIPKGATNRAISTPKGVDVNLTFDEGLSAIYCDQSANPSGEMTVLHVNSREQQTPALRQWNVQSPLRRKK
ncbi:condensin-2 complex subunit D3 [Genypterus blacodes]|uniref:condensin-2 complex subunit D3 n=1 Tax=Genypterus blacodes TaxID=154954 RepID=UPI003F766134